MKFDVKFKSLDHSQALVEHVEERFSKVAKFEIKPVTVHVTFSQVRHNSVAEVFIHGMKGDFRARGESDSLYTSLDMCLKKLKRQMEKEKALVKHHRNEVRSEKNSRRAA